MNYFDILLAKKLEDDRDPKVEGLSVTENGRYHEDGVVYDPVIVNVNPTLKTKSITQNGTYQASSDNADGYSSVNVNVEGYKISEVSGLPSSIASFSDGSNLPMPKLKCSIEAVQSGSGDPSPTNIRPISGWDEANITVADDDTDPTVSNVYTIDLNGTRYGGTLDVVSGVLTVTYAKIGLADISKSKYGSYQYGIRTITTFFDSIPNSSLLTGMSNTFALSDSGESYNVDKCSIVFANGNSKTSFLISTQASGLSADASVTEIDAWLRSIDAYIVYELATPLTIQLTPTAVKSLLGTNNLFADCGDVVEASYWEEL